jgi:hypothetical protein
MGTQVFNDAQQVEKTIFLNNVGKLEIRPDTGMPAVPSPSAPFVNVENICYLSYQTGNQ